MTYPELCERLFGLRRFGVRPGLKTTREALAAVGDPHRGLRVIHVAGTNGKGSTAAFIEALLRAGGLRTGLYTSPHLLRFTERIRVCGAELEADEAAALGARVLGATPEVTFFEAATVMALSAFQQHGVEVAVLEAGLGGRLDSTNVIEAPLATVVTGVALDHTDVLGPTLADVAREKAGIFKPGVPAVFAARDGEARVLDEAAAKVGARAYRLGRELSASALPASGRMAHDLAPDGGAADEGARLRPRLAYRGPGGPLEAQLGLSGEHQLANAALALAAVALAGIELSDDERRRGLAEVRWPGRLEQLRPDVWCDAAHNPDGAEVLARALPRLAGGRPITLVFGVAADKDAQPMLAALAPLCARIVLTRPPSPRALDPQALLGLCPTAEVEPEPARAIERALGRPLASAEARGREPLVVVAGSIFLVGEARRVLLGEPADPLAVQDPPPSVR